MPDGENSEIGDQSQSAGDGAPWMALAGGTGGSPRGAGYAIRFVDIGACIPAGRLTIDELMASTKYKTGIELERLTGVRECPVVGVGEDSYTLALGAARDALTHPAAKTAAGPRQLVNHSAARLGTPAASPVTVANNRPRGRLRR